MDMDIAAAGMGSPRGLPDLSTQPPAQVPTQQAQNVSAPKGAPDPSLAKVGDALNNMSGISSEKNLYEAKKELGKDDFLKMFMEQLKHQDPLNPVKDEQFGQQMAMFGQLEQAINANKMLEKLV